MKADGAMPTIKIGTIFFPFFTKGFKIKFRKCDYFKKDGSPLKPASANNTGEIINDQWELKPVAFSSSDLAEEDILLLINYKLGN